MSRTLSSGVVAELALRRKLRQAFLLSIYFDGDTINITDYHKSITVNGVQWDGAGELLDFDGLEETLATDVTILTVSLSGVTREWFSTFLSQLYLDRRLTVELVLLSEDERVIMDPVLIFDGRMDSPVISDDPDGGTSTLSVSATNQWVDFERIPGRHTNHEEQQTWFSGDRGFYYAAQLVNKKILWGRAT